LLTLYLAVNPLQKMCLVLKDTSFEFAGDTYDTYVENAMLAARDVYEV